MTTVRLIPGATQTELTARSRVAQLPPSLREIPGGLFPLKTAAFVIDEYRIMSGWPVAVPPCDIRVPVLISAEGIVLDSRDAPTSLVTGADLRWIADVDYYDQVALLWRPIQGESSPWQTSSDHAPSLITDYEYRVGDERFVDMTALNFDSNTADYMWINLDLIMGGTSGYTVIMVVNPNSIYGNDEDVTENGLWGPEDLDDAYAYFTVVDQAVFMSTESYPSQRGVPIANGLNSTAPTFLAMVVSRPQTTLYAASGPSDVLVKSLPSGPRPEPLSTRFWLGNTPFAKSGTMDMALLDLGIYANPLSRREVVSEFALLSQVYGGDAR